MSARRVRPWRGHHHTYMLSHFAHMNAHEPEAEGAVHSLARSGRVGDGNGMQSSADAYQRLKAVSRRHAQLFQNVCRADRLDLAKGDTFDIRKFSDTLSGSKLCGALVGNRRNHT